jgi:hypothetical protein
MKADKLYFDLFYPMNDSKENEERQELLDFIKGMKPSRDMSYYDNFTVEQLRIEVRYIID